MNWKISGRKWSWIRKALCSDLPEKTKGNHPPPEKTLERRKTSFFIPVLIGFNENVQTLVVGTFLEKLKKSHPLPRFVKNESTSSRSLDPVISQMNPLHILQPHFCKAHFNITTGSSKLSLLLIFCC
jgi:hypothetical protein